MFFTLKGLYVNLTSEISCRVGLRSNIQRCRHPLDSIPPGPAERATETASEDAHGRGESPRMSWPRLLKRVFDIDVEHCPNCGGALKIIAAIEDPPVIVKILSHLGLPTRAPLRAPARRVDLFQTI
jgi:hypothetical protein